MIDGSIRDYVRLINSVTLSQSDKDRIAEFLINRDVSKKEFSKKHVAAASAVVILAVGVFFAARETKQNIDVNVM